MLIGTMTPAAHARDPGAVTITLEPDYSLRELAQTYLHDPDAWPEILRANRLDSADQLHPGIQLRIPVAAILELDRAMQQLHTLIYRATEAGAQVFATESISEATVNHAGALEARRQGTLDGAMERAQRGIAAAGLALKISLRNRAVPAEAVLDSAAGTVQLRRPSDFDWTAIEVKALLAEQERLRTLSRSYAVVRFRDASSLRIGENAELALRRIRRDRLTRREQANVVLYGGDIRTLLESDAHNRAVEVEVPGMETRIRSKHYWLQKDRKSTRLANYDGEIEVTAQDATVVVRQNQGTVVTPNAPPHTPVDLLSAPTPYLPENGQIVYGTSVDLSWEDNVDAMVYWLEVARDRELKQPLFHRTAIEGASYYLPVALQGLYYWRVSAVDGAGLPGPASEIRSFRLSWDSTPPYLVVRTPANGYHSRDATLAIAGRTESGARLTLNGAPVPVDDEGRFAVEKTLDEGTETLLLEARDPAGNLTRMERVVHLSTGSGLPLDFADGLPRDDQARLIVNRPRFSFEGSTLAGATIRIQTREPSAFEASAVADDEGRFRLTLPARAGISRFVIDAEGPAGLHARQHFDVVLDTSPPRIHLDTPPPDRTSNPVLHLNGLIEGGIAMTHEDHAVSLSSDGRFTLEIPLQAGAQLVALTARDLAGNQSVWQQTVVLDQAPPRLADYRLIPDDTVVGGPVVVEIMARDESELTAGVPYSLQAGDFVHRGIARRSPDKRYHRDRVAFPPTAVGQPRLRSVILQDYLGNREEIQID